MLFRNREQGVLVLERFVAVSGSRMRVRESHGLEQNQVLRRCGMRHMVVGHMVMARGSRRDCMISSVTLLPSRTPTVGATGFT